MVKIIWSAQANLDLIQIYNYISQDSIFYARKTIDNIIKKTEYLYQFPYMGRALQYSKENCRELIYKSYTIQYLVNSDIIYIHRIWHSARNISNLFSK